MIYLTKDQKISCYEYLLHNLHTVLADACFDIYEDRVSFCSNVVYSEMNCIPLFMLDELYEFKPQSCDPAVCRMESWFTRVYDKNDLYNIEHKKTIIAFCLAILQYEEDGK